MSIFKYVKQFIKWLISIFKKLADPLSISIFIILWIIVSGVGMFVIGWIFRNAWLISSGGALMLIWAGPGTPLIPILIVVALGIAKMIRKPKLAGRYALIISLSMVIASGPITIDIVQENYNSQEGGLYDQRAIKHITEETYISMA